MKALTLRLEDGVHEALRREAFNAQLPISEIIRTAINAHINAVFKMTHPASICDWLDCTAPAVGLTTPGGFHFCAEHLPSWRELAVSPKKGQDQ